MKPIQGVPESSISAVEFPQEENVEHRGAKLFAEGVLHLRPPVRQLVNGASVIKLPMQMQRSRGVFHSSEDGRHNKKENTSVEEEKDRSSHRHLPFELAPGLPDHQEGFESKS